MALRDPIAVNIVRCHGLNAARESYRYRDGRFEQRGPNVTEALTQFERIDEEALKTFDVITAAAMKEYRTKLAELT